MIFDRGIAKPYSAYSSSKGLLGGPTLVHAMSRCGVGLGDRGLHLAGPRRRRPLGPASSRGPTSRWSTSPATRAGVCDYEDASTVCRDEYAGMADGLRQGAGGGPAYVYPLDLFTVARARAEQNRRAGLDAGHTWQYSNVGHALLNYVVQRACGQSLTDIYQQLHPPGGHGRADRGAGDLQRRGPGVQSKHRASSSGTGSMGRRCCGWPTRAGIWDNRNVEPVADWNRLTRITGNIAAAAALGWGVSTTTTPPTSGRPTPATAGSRPSCSATAGTTATSS